MSQPEGPHYAYFEGEIVPFTLAMVSIMNTTFNYGTGAFAGLRGYWNEEEEELFVFRPLDHFRRFLDSARLLRFQLDHTPESLTGALLDLLRAEGWRTNTYIRPLAYIADNKVGVKLHGMRYAVAIYTLPFGSYVEDEEGVHATISSWRRVDDNAIPPRGKLIGSYVNSAFIKSDAELSGYDEAIVLNEDGHISEGSAENIFIVRNGTVLTPPVYGNVLEGITRRTLMQLMRDELGLSVVERQIDRSELLLADEAFFCGTGVQIAAITRVDHRPIGTGRLGPVAAAIRDLYFRVVSGRVGKYRAWNTPVYTHIPA